MNILALNCGSSSLKYQLFDWTKNERLATGAIERIGQAGAFIKHKFGTNDAKKREIECKNHDEAIQHVLDAIFENGKISIEAVGHRVVHGGSKFSGSVIVDSDVIAGIEELIPLAPLHNGANLSGILAAKKLLPNATQVAVFDSAFHQTMPPEAYTYAVPRSWIEEGVRRYGFHGTSHLFVSRKVAKMLGKDVKDLKIITCHIGNGASITAVEGGKSRDTSMGFTPLAGVIMGTRSGDIDPGVISYIHTQDQIPFEHILEDLNKKSGMLGLTGFSDLRDVEERYEQGDPTCTKAMEAYSYQIKKFIGAYAAAMNGVDVIVFTAGVGENSPIVRELALKDLEFFGVKLDKEANNRTWRGVEGMISTPDSTTKVAVVSTNEELIIIEDTVALMEGRNPSDPNFHYSFENGTLAAK